MAEDVTIGTSGALFVDEDKTVKLELLDTSDVPVDMSGWTVVLDVRSTDKSGTSLLSKTASITGSYNSTRASNTQRAVFTIADTDQPASTFTRTSTPYRYSIKRTDAGSETILAYGNWSPQRPTQV